MSARKKKKKKEFKDVIQKASFGEDQLSLALLSAESEADLMDSIGPMVDEVGLNFRVEHLGKSCEYGKRKLHVK